MTKDAEDRIPALARKAFSRAHADAQKAGHAVLVRSGNRIERILPSGQRELVKMVEPMVEVTRGARYALR